LQQPGRLHPGPHPSRHRLKLSWLEHALCSWKLYGKARNASPGCFRTQLWKGLTRARACCVQLGRSYDAKQPTLALRDCLYGWRGRRFSRFLPVHMAIFQRAQEIVRVQNVSGFQSQGYWTITNANHLCQRLHPLQRTWQMCP